MALITRSGGRISEFFYFYVEMDGGFLGTGGLD